MNKKLANFIQKKQANFIQKNKKLAQKKQTKGDEVIDWESRRDTYIAVVNNLYEKITTLFAGSGICCILRRKSLSESYIGTYSIDNLVLLIGNEQVRFSPVGCCIAGCSGRIDVLGDRDIAVLITQSDLHWEYVLSRQPELRVAQFDESVLLDILQMVMR